MQILGLEWSAVLIEEDVEVWFKKVSSPRTPLIASTLELVAGPLHGMCAEINILELSIRCGSHAFSLFSLEKCTYQSTKQVSLLCQNLHLLFLELLCIGSD